MGFKPNWIYRINSGSYGVVRYGHLEGIDSDIVAYATQSSEAAVIIPHKGSEIRMEIMKENFSHSDDHLYIGFRHEEITKLKKAFPELPNSKVTYNNIKVEFEVKHSYFNNLIRSVSCIPDDIMKRLLPKLEEFQPRSSAHFQYTKEMQPLVSQLDPYDQLNALKTVTMHPCSSPPVLINGSFGTGKSRVLAIATYFITEKSTDSQPARVLLCAHHQASADYFVETYFGEIMQKYSWRVKHFFRVTSSRYVIRGEKLNQLSRYFLTLKKLKEKVQGGRINYGNLVIVTTFLTALNLSKLFPRGFFTHILMDEGAQSREAEAIAPLTLASTKTQIVIAGDSNQVYSRLYVQFI